MFCTIEPTVVFSLSSSPLTYSRSELPSATHATCVQRCSGTNEFDHSLRAQAARG